jgi:hypothetical protein
MRAPANSRRANACRRRAQVLVEFAAIALVLYLLLAGTLEFGRAIYCAQVTQHAADLCAREISRTPLPVAKDNLYFGLENPAVLANVYDPSYLVIDLSQHGSNLDSYFAGLPIVNQQLRTVMIVDYIGSTQVLRYPGAIATGSQGTYPFTNSPYTVVIPLITHDANGNEMFDPAHNWANVVEEIAPSTGSSYPITSQQRGVIALRINYPYQAATLGGYALKSPGTSDPNKPIQVTALDATTTGMFQMSGGPMSVNLVPGNPPPSDPNRAWLTSGNLGLGNLYAQSQNIRPYRKVISSQAIYRREVFQ